MEKDCIGKSGSSFKEYDSLKRTTTYSGSSEGAKMRRFNGCFSFKEISIDPGVKSLKHLDSLKLKDEIRRWAKAVVSYARQVSQRFGSSRKSVGDD